MQYQIDAKPICCWMWLTPTCSIRLQNRASTRNEIDGRVFTHTHRTIVVVASSTSGLHPHCRLEWPLSLHGHHLVEWKSDVREVQPPLHRTGQYQASLMLCMAPFFLFFFFFMLLLVFLFGLWIRPLIRRITTSDAFHSARFTSSPAAKCCNWASCASSGSLLTLTWKWCSLWSSSCCCRYATWSYPSWSSRNFLML